MYHTSASLTDGSAKNFFTYIGLLMSATDSLWLPSSGNSTREQ